MIIVIRNPWLLLIYYVYMFIDHLSLSFQLFIHTVCLFFNAFVLFSYQFVGMSCVYCAIFSFGCMDYRYVLPTCDFLFICLMIGFIYKVSVLMCLCIFTFLK